jgi:hypothetical protein
MLLLIPTTTLGQTPLEEKVAVLITDWGMPAGYNFEYAWRAHDAARVGDLTEYEGQPCKIGHVGEFPYEAHMGLVPWGLANEVPGFEIFFDSSGIYRLEGGVYMGIHPDMPSLTPGEIPVGAPITPVVELISAMTGELDYPPDPRTGENYLDGWLKIGSRDSVPMPNGYGDFYEASPLRFMWYYGHLSAPTEPPEAYELHPNGQAIHDATIEMLNSAFGDRIDVRLGMYNKVTGFSEHEWDVAEDFANEGFRKMLLARETTDHNRYANEFFTANYIKERLCELGVLNETEIHQTRQVGRTPEFNTMNVINLKEHIEAYPEGSTIAMVYVTRGLPWGSSETPAPMGTIHPWSKEVYHDNAFLNYLSWKKALQNAYGDRYNLVFTEGDVESDLLQDSLYAYGVYGEDKLGGHFHTVRSRVQAAKESGIDKIIIAPCHWYFDNFDTLVLTPIENDLAMVPKPNIEAEIFYHTYCEDLAGNEVDCESPDAVAEITLGPSYSHRTQEFATSYYVVLQGTLERFGLYPEGEEPMIETSQLVTKLSGGTVEVTSPSSPIDGAKIEIPADPYPDRPDDFTRETGIPINDPTDSNDCMWEDTTITIGYREAPPSMSVGVPAGPAVHFGPYRTFFNRDVTVTLPFDLDSPNAEVVGVYIYNHLSEDWDLIPHESVDTDNQLVTFKTKVLGLFQVALDMCEGDFDCDSDCDGTDAGIFKMNFGRGTLNHVCTYDDPCYGDFDEDNDVDGTDASKFKEDFGRSMFHNPCPACNKPIGVLYALHGGMDEVQNQYMWNASVMMFSYDQNHAVNQFVIWNPPMWPSVLDTETTDFAARFIRKYEFTYPQIGGVDHFQDISNQQLADMQAALDTNPYGLQFESDWVGWIPGDYIDHYPYPRFVYYGPDGLPDPEGDYPDVTYCGEGEPEGPWATCNPERYNVDGPVERLLKKGAYRIVIIDTAVGGVRFYKPFDIVQMTKRVTADWEKKYGLNVPVLWVNDYSDLMERSYPTEPEGWTYFLGPPATDQHVLVDGSPNPVAEDPDLALLHVEGIEASMNHAVGDADTGVVLFNHGLFDPDRRFFDPKMDDTTILNENIKAQLLQRHPDMDPDNIIGAFGGIKELNPENGRVEVNRDMRGENLAHVYPHEADQALSGHPWGYRYWDALDYLKTRGVQHIIFDFPQVIVDSVLSVEVYNQIAKEIGTKTWLKWETWDYDTYPTAGHPFADYWGNWVNTDCGEWDLSYDNGTSPFSSAATLTGQTSGATGVIKWLSGDTTSGILTLKGVSGTFQDDEVITDGLGGSALANSAENQTSKTECCFVMGGCNDSLRPYPPPRQTPLSKAMSDLDTMLGFDNSAYGLLGYDRALGPPNPDQPVQDQYTGTWEFYAPPDDDPRVGALLAKHVLNATVNPRVYITNGEVGSITAGQSVTFQAHVTGGHIPYSYEWSLKEENDPSWTAVGINNPVWMWTSLATDQGVYDIRCTVTDEWGHMGEVVWKDFPVE